jgi:hypothetical protein
MKNNQETNKEMEKTYLTTYEGSEAWKATEYCNDPEILQVRKQYTEHAIRYWIRERNEGQVNFFREAVKHVNRKLKEIDKDLNPYTVKEKHLEFIQEAEQAKQEYKQSSAFQKVTNMKNRKGLEEFKTKVLKFIEKSNYRRLDARIWIECLKHLNKRLDVFKKEESKAWN